VSSRLSSEHERHPAPAGQVDDVLVATLGPSPETARVLDCGGGTGRFAVPLAVSGARVTVVDVSADALATLLRRASEAGVADRVRAVQGDVEAVTDLFDGEQFDLVLAHGVLAAVDDLPGAFAGIVATVRAGGVLSVLVDNPVAGVLARALVGDLAGAEREIDALDSPGRGGVRADPEAVLQLCAEHGLIVEQQHGLGIFRDLVPGEALEQPGARDALARLEAACAQRSPFAQIAARVHVLARRTSGA
jgi:S-adenosylmethionine-dependent methyltransferase